MIDGDALVSIWLPFWNEIVWEAFYDQIDRKPLISFMASIA